MSYMIQQIMEAKQLEHDLANAQPPDDWSRGVIWLGEKPITDRGYILPQEEFETWVKVVREFYLSTPKTDIEQHNRERATAELKAAAPCYLVADIPEPTPSKKPKEGYVYLMNSDGLHKIGISNDPQKRSRAIRRIEQMPIKLLHSVYADDVYYAENWWHWVYRFQWVRGEWFVLEPHHIERFLAWGQ